MIQISAVLTGDLIGSTRADPKRVERTMTVLEHQATLIAEATKADTRFTRFRGDGWQIFLQDPKHFLWVAVYLNAILKADPDGTVPTRIAIGLGTADQLGVRDLSAAKGTAFTSSGRALDNMSNGQTLALAGAETDDIQRSVIAFIQDCMAGWSQEQAEVVRLKLTPGNDPTHGEMATQLGISRQAVGSRLQASGFELINDAVRAFGHHFTPKGSVP